VKQYRVKILFVAFLSISLLSFSLIRFAPTLTTKRLAKPPYVNKAQSILRERTKKGLETTAVLMEQYLKAKNTEQLFDTLTTNLNSKLERDGLAIFLFENDELIFWSENLDISSIPEESTKLVFAQNAWCLSYWLSGEGIKGLVLVKVKYGYPYQNKFLRNRYHHSLSFLENYSVSAEPVEGAFPITLFSTQPAFYLSHIPQFFDEECSKIRATLVWIGFFALLIAFYTFFWLPAVRRQGLLSVLTLVITLPAIRLLSLYFQWLPQTGWALFEPAIFAYSWVLPSLGDFFLNSLIVFALACYVYWNLSENSLKESKYRDLLLVFLSGMAIFSTFLAIDFLFSTLIINSTIALETYKIISLSYHSILGYFSISLWVAAGILVIDKSLHLLKRIQRYLLNWLIPVSCLISIAFFFLLGLTPTIYGMALCLAVVIFVLKQHGLNTMLSAHHIFILVFLFAVYSVLLVSDYAERKDRDIRKVIAVNLSNERDPIAEVLFPAITKKIHTDPEVKRYLENIAQHEADLYNHLNDQYLGGYFKKYDFQITTCFSTSDLIIEKTGEVTRCYDFFEEMINEYGLRIPGTSFFYLSNDNGRISYLGILEYVLDDGREICIYLELDTKISSDLLGYPELLLEGKLTEKSALDNYSTAKYSGNQLVAKTGDYDYPHANPFTTDSLHRYSFVDVNGYNHLVYETDSNLTMVLSRPKVNLFDITASFAWVLIFFYLTLILLHANSGISFKKGSLLPSLRFRIQRIMVQLLTLSLVMIGVVTITYNVKSFQRKNLNNLMEKLSSTKVEIESHLVNEDLIHPEYTDYITYYLVHLSNVFYCDINLYDSSGQLISSSRPEIFERKLMGNMINPVAWNAIAQKDQAKFIHTEQIGKMKYLSAYIPLEYYRNERIGYLNLPYFTRQSEFINEVFAVIVALINLYALLILIALSIALLVSNRITQPLQLIREKLGKIDITKHNEPIHYEGKDEVGLLVNEYNRVIIELTESAKMLALSQRQSAWREMAKQVAHEIKNPLTPIKLNLQYIVKAKQENDAEWETLFDNFAQILVEQINVLSTIATEFSNFAKMPTGVFQDVNLKRILEDAINLFAGYPGITLKQNLEGLEGVTVFSDKDQLSRVFVNLIKNAVQAIERNKEGLIEVTYERAESHVTISIEDNGCGISPESEAKMFSPNFTTKSGGMGLGLAMSKEIVESLDGKIWFETAEGVGTRFFVKLKKSNI